MVIKQRRAHNPRPIRRRRRPPRTPAHAARCLEELESKTLLTTLTVTSTADSGAGTLRQAILTANSLSGTTTIDFSIGTGLATIQPTTPLPTITRPVVIDGTSQP